MKDHIKGNIKLSRRGVITSIAFFMESIANKYTSKCSRFQLSSQAFLKMHKGCTSKNFKEQIRYGRSTYSVMKDIKGSLKLQGTRGHMVDEIGCSSDDFTPIIGGHMSSKQGSTNNLKKVTIFSFSYPVLLRSVRTSSLMNNAMQI